MPLDRVKLDQSLIAEIETSEKARVVVQAVVHLIKGVGCEIVAEAVENSAQADLLRAMGCDTVQGYVFAEPMFEDEFEAWLEKERTSVLPKSPIGKAFTYTRNQWAALRRYTEDGVLAIDNNVSERTVKIAAIGRKNWLFVGSATGGQRAAILFSLVASCKANQVEPFAYLRDLFQMLAERRSASPEDIEDLLPDRWLVSNPGHRWEIDELRAEERKRSRKQRITRRASKT